MDGLAPFLGEWALITDGSRVGQAPVASTLLLEDLGDRLLLLVLFTGEDGRTLRLERELSYDAPTESGSATVTLEMTADGALETIVREGEVEVARARRVLREDGVLEITQRGVTHEGEAFAHVARYQRVE